MSISDFHIRKAQEPDLPFVRSCAKQAYEIYVPRIGKAPAPMVADFAASLADGHLDIIQCDGSDIGFAVTFANKDHLFIENIALLPDHQGKGHAKRLFRYFEERAARDNLSALKLYTNERMTENLNLYPRLGFVETDRLQEDGFSRVYFRKEL